MDNFYQTGDNTYTGIAFTPDWPGCDQVEVVASISEGTYDEAPENLASCRQYARLLYHAPKVLRDLQELVELLDSDAETINTKYARATLDSIFGRNA